MMERHDRTGSRDQAGATDSYQEAQAGPSPLIDRELFFGSDEVAAVQLSPDGHHLAGLMTWKDSLNIFVKAIDESFSAARLLTAETRDPVVDYCWTWDSKYILYMKDGMGDEDFSLHAVDVSAEIDPGEDAGRTRELISRKGAQILLYELPKGNPDIAYIGVNDRDKAWHDLYQIQISTGEKRLLFKNTERIVNWVFNRMGQLRLAVRRPVNGDMEILRTDADGFKTIYRGSIFDSVWLERLHPDGKRAYLRTNKGENLISVALLDLETGEVETVETDPEGRADLMALIYSEATDHLAGTVYCSERERVYFKDQAFAADYRWLQSCFPGSDLRLTSRTLDESRWMILQTSDTEPGKLLVFDRAARTLTPQFTMREKLLRAHLAEMKAVTYTSSDGLEIHAYLTLPKGVPAIRLPALICPHGGPWARSFWGYNPKALFFSNRGYAVLSPNFRGSTGYGRKFLDAGNLEWGRKMQDDLGWGVKYLVEEGIADPERIGILGASYGGYAALAGAAFTPHLYAAAIALAGICNLLTFLDAIPMYWEGDRMLWHTRMGDPTTQEGKALLMERSPLLSADRIKTPLLVVHGLNDPRCAWFEAEQIVVALRNRGFPVEYLLVPDEGHAFVRPVNTSAVYMTAERFFASHLAGRFQADGLPEVIKRIEEITVNPMLVW